MGKATLIATEILECLSNPGWITNPPCHCLSFSLESQKNIEWIVKSFSLVETNTSSDFELDDLWLLKELLFYFFEIQEASQSFLTNGM